MVAALGLLTACDPSKDDISMPGNSKLTGEQLAEGFQVVQYADEEYTTEAADGNYFTFTTSPARVVTVYQLDEEGSRNELSAGTANGKFKIVPKRGNPTEQVYYVETKDFNGNTITATKTATVFVPSELAPEMRLLASDAYGSKTWTWDTEFREDGGTWGNVGYAAGEDWTSGIWFACPPADLTGQLQHSDTGVANGEEDPDAYMTFDWKTGAIKSFNAAGTEIRSGKFEIPAWYNGAKGQASIDGSQANWAYGTLATDPGSILFPFKINGGGTKVGEFEIVDISSDKLKLIYVAPGTGSWGEATWWAFKKVDKTILR